MDNLKKYKAYIFSQAFSWLLSVPSLNVCIFVVLFIVIKKNNVVFVVFVVFVFLQKI